MSEEIFDVVNEKDEVIGRKPRAEVHKLGLKHRAVHLLVFNRTGQIFLQKRSMLKDNFPGVWDSSSSGHLDAGETYDACVIREAREELGLHLPVLPEKLCKIDACPDTGEEFVWLYQAVSDGPFVLHPEEIETGDWFGPMDVTKWVENRPEDFASGFRLVWATMLQNGWVR